MRATPVHSSMRALLTSAATLAQLDEVPMAPAISSAALAETYTKALELIADARQHVTGPSSVLIT